MRLRNIKIIILSIILMIILSACNDGHVDLILNNQLLHTEIAADTLSWAKGLSGRDKLCKNCAMIFIFGEASKYPFWMKDMNFPLDIIYIKDDKIVDLFKNVQVLNDFDKITEVFPNHNADKVLELNAGWCDLHNVQIGDIIKYKL